MRIDEPSGDECGRNAPVVLPDGRTGFACWYPQMGGYVGKAVAIPQGKEPGLDGDPCFDLLVWHDGDFPFSDGHKPTELHHCDPEHFVTFGKALQRMAGSSPMDDDDPAAVLSAIETLDDREL